MRILWACPLFLHPTTKGGQIRTLGMLRCLHRRHEIHYVALHDASNREGVERSAEYCSRAYPIAHRVPPKTSPMFIAQLARGLWSPLPVAVSRFESRAMRETIARLLREQAFDSIVCDFLASAPNIPDLSQAVLFQHNVETVIWERREQNASNVALRALYRQQARRMREYEGKICREVRRVVAVSEQDAARMRQMFGVTQISDVPTGVDLEYFAPPEGQVRGPDLVFVGSMDWAPNVDGMLYFIREILPLVRAERPDCRVIIAGRTPAQEILDAAAGDPLIDVTGTAPDIRPYLWSAAASIVPLRIGGGTRLKIFEAMAAKTPVVSTTIGAEGLPVTDRRHLYLADDPASFARCCVQLLANGSAARQMAENAWRLVNENFSWEHAARRFEEALVNAPGVRA